MGLRNRVRRALAGREASQATVAAPPAPPIAPPVDPLVDPIGAAEQAEGEGRLLDAMDLLIAANRRSPDPDIEQRLVLARHRAHDEVIAAGLGRAEWPPSVPDLTPGLVGIPEVHREDLTTEIVASAVVHHGSLLVRGVLQPDDIEHLRHVIDETFTNYDAWDQDGVDPEFTKPWFDPFFPEGAYAKNHETMARGWVREAGGVSTVDSPRGLYDFLEILDRCDIRDILTEYFGERPAISAKKNTLRRVPTHLTLSDWHQDGAFLGQDIRSLNVWLALTRCGGDTDVPGLDIVPRRMHEVLETGVEGAIFNWSVGGGLVEPLLEETPIVRPEFAPGDALLFDEMMLHRTAIPEQKIGAERYAVESWFFSPSFYPQKEVPLIF